MNTKSLIIYISILSFIMIFCGPFIDLVQDVLIKFTLIKAIIKCIICFLLFSFILFIKIYISIRKYSSFKFSLSILDFSSKELEILDFIYKNPEPFFISRKTDSPEEFKIIEKLMDKGYLTYLPLDNGMAAKLTEKSSKIFKNDFFIVNVLAGGLYISTKKFKDLNSADAFIREEYLKYYSTKNYMIICKLEPSQKIFKELSTYVFK